MLRDTQNDLNKIAMNVKCFSVDQCLDASNKDLFEKSKDILSKYNTTTKKVEDCISDKK